MDARESCAARILLISDDAQLRALVSQLLAAHRYEVVAVEGAACAAHRSADCDAAIVDAATQRAARWLRGLDNAPRVPTIAIAAAKGGAAMEWLWSRVDAVLPGPLDARKLLLIVRGLFASRREERNRTERTLTAGPITLDALVNAATVDTREVLLTDAETRVLRELMLAASTPVSRDRLTRSSLGRGRSADDRCLDTHIKRLRRKLGHDRHGRTPIRTVRGIGYLLLEQWQPRG